MKENKKPFNPIYSLHNEDKYNQVIDEKGSQFIALRRVQWGEGEKDENKANFELRRWRVEPDGTESPAKGVVFLTDQGPHNCVTGLIEAGFGNTKEIILKLKERDDFRKAVETLYDDTEISDNNGEFFDARELLLNE